MGLIKTALWGVGSMSRGRYMESLPVTVTVKNQIPKARQVVNRHFLSNISRIRHSPLSRGPAWHDTLPFYLPGTQICITNCCEIFIFKWKVMMWYPKAPGFCKDYVLLRLSQENRTYQNPWSIVGLSGYRPVRNPYICLTDPVFVFTRTLSPLSQIPHYQ